MAEMAATLARQLGLSRTANIPATIASARQRLGVPDGGGLVVEAQRCWLAASPPKRFRHQQYAPPASFEAGRVLALYTAGDGDARKRDQPAPPAGSGFVAVRYGRTGRGDDGQRLYSWATCVSVGAVTCGVRPKTVTDNLAHLAAFACACEWALADPRVRGLPIVLRYTNEYAANVGTALWNPRKHKPMAAAAQLAFRRLRAQRGGQVYIEYVNPKNDWAATAMSLAARGKGGEDVRVLDVD